MENLEGLRSEVIGSTLGDKQVIQSQPKDATEDIDKLRANVMQDTLQPSERKLKEPEVKTGPEISEKKPEMPEKKVESVENKKTLTEDTEKQSMKGLLTQVLENKESEDDDLKEIRSSLCENIDSSLISDIMGMR